MQERHKLRTDPAHLPNPHSHLTREKNSQLLANHGLHIHSPTLLHAGCRHGNRAPCLLCKCLGRFAPRCLNRREHSAAAPQPLGKNTGSHRLHRTTYRRLPWRYPRPQAHAKAPSLHFRNGCRTLLSAKEWPARGPPARRSRPRRGCQACRTIYETCLVEPRVLGISWSVRGDVVDYIFLSRVFALIGMSTAAQKVHTTILTRPRERALRFVEIEAIWNLEKTAQVSKYSKALAENMFSNSCVLLVELVGFQSNIGPTETCQQRVQRWMYEIAHGRLRTCG